MISRWILLVPPWRGRLGGARTSCAADTSGSPPSDSEDGLSEAYLHLKTQSGFTGSGAAPGTGVAKGKGTAWPVGRCADGQGAARQMLADCRSRITQVLHWPRITPCASRRSRGSRR